MSLFAFPRSPRDFPDALQGGEGLESPDHRVGETTHQGPAVDDVEPQAVGPEAEHEEE